ncbi:esterase/lipase family protein [Acetobacter cibinongensis]|uniref:esterase/lipase family protein n=1 Tax=Acetobacter cibinongensis TaxID=146475 RepID=UPI001F0B4D85|nr:alpha/beta hydrolase [Acetobacter cibinongensis]
MVFLSGCAAPITVTERSLTQTYKARNQSALISNTLSTTSLTTLRRQNLLDTWRRNPAEAINRLRSMTQRQFYAQSLTDQLFTLSELTYLHARKTHDKAYFMAAALYAYAYLNPRAPDAERPSPFSQHFRQACDIYMLSLTEAFGAPVQVASQHWTLPFGTLDLDGVPSSYKWYGHSLADLRPLARLSITGIENIYSHTGLGEPVGALPRLSNAEDKSFTISDKLRVPLNLQLVLPSPRTQILSNTLQGHLALTAMDEAPRPNTTSPRQYDQTAARAVSLDETMDWSLEYKGFLDGRLFDQTKSPQLFTIEPHQYGHRPVILVHGTASSAARWASMVNDLMEDPVIRQNYEFWFFSYATGNPIPYSALQLRQALSHTIQQLGGTQADPALGQMTLIGHSQGGLLIKLLAIDAGNKLWDGMVPKPLDSLKISEKYKQFLHETLFPAPLPDIKSVVFISTPQHGSYLAGFSIAHMVGRMVSFPLTVTEATRAVLASDPTLRRLNMRPWRVGSVYGMSPHSAFMRSLAPIPVTPDITAHSIIPVTGTAQNLEKADDGVVTYKSAHVPYVASELVVPHSGHSTQSNPITIAEVRRLLLENLQQTTTTETLTKQDVSTMGGVYRSPEHPLASSEQIQQAQATP